MDVPDLLPGTLDLLILRILAADTMHGYAIAQRLKTAVEGRPAGRRELALSGAAAPAAQRLRRRRVGTVGEQPQGALLHDYPRRPETARRRARGVRSAGRRDPAGPAEGLEGDAHVRVVPTTACAHPLPLVRCRPASGNRNASRDGRGGSAGRAASPRRRESGRVANARQRDAGAREARGVWYAPWLESVWQDVRFGVRSLRRSPVFTVTALLTMAIGIGLNTAMFTAFNAIALRGWPVENADTLVLISESTDQPGPRSRTGFSLDDFEDFQRRSQTLSVVAAQVPGVRVRRPSARRRGRGTRTASS